MHWRRWLFLKSRASAGTLCPTCHNIDFAQYFRQEMHVWWDKESLPYLVGPIPDAIRMGTLAEVHSTSRSCAFCDLVLAALCRNRSLWKWTDPQAYVQRTIERGQLEDPAVYLYSYLYAEDTLNGVGMASDLEGNGLEDPSRRSFQLGIGLRRPASNAPNRPYLDRAGVINLVSSSDEEIGIGPSFYGRIVKDTGANINLAKSWLKECVNLHGTLCEEWSETNDYERTAPRHLRVIDVQYMCLVMLPPGSKYIALSYCWGSSNRHFKTTKSSLAELEKRKSVKKIFSSLSGTIQDAIHCMDRVYQSSLITIISASPLPEFKSGYDYLPGYRAGTRLFTQESAQVRGLKLCTSFASVEEITDPRNTIWSTRAWTFQEELLSRRRLYFTLAQLYFQCSCGVFCEDVVGERKSPSAYVYESCSLWNSSGLYTNATNCSAYGVTAREGLSRITFKSQEESFSFYMDMVERYSCRNMSSQSDALIALEGVLEVLRKTMQTHFIWGLPESLFDDALLWMQLGGPHRRRDAISNGYHGRQFPTWSWAGWEGRSNYRADFFSIYTRPEIDWFLTTNDGMITKLFRIERTSLNNSFNAVDHQIVRPRGGPPIEFLKKLRSRDEVNKRYFKSASIVCWTSIASFRFSGGVVDEGEGASNWPNHQSFIICDSKSRDVGAIRMERTWAARLGEETRFQFMLLSRANIVENMTSLDEDIFPIHDWSFLNILLIQRSRETAQRLGIGWVHENAWVDASPASTLMRLD